MKSEKSKARIRMMGTRAGQLRARVETFEKGAFGMPSRFDVDIGSGKWTRLDSGLQDTIITKAESYVKRLQELLTPFIDERCEQFDEETS